MYAEYQAYKNGPESKSKMIYLLSPRDGSCALRIFSNYGLMEQVARSRGGDWCIVYGYELGIDEYNLVWIWHQGPGGYLIRSPVKS
jgi:hypothetical protein